MPNQITGRLIRKGTTVQIQPKSGGSPLMKREFVLDATPYDPYTGELSEHANILPLELVGERCADLDRFREGELITVSFALQGRSWRNQDGEEKRMVSVRCYRLEARQTAQQAPQHVHNAQAPAVQQIQAQAAAYAQPPYGQLYAQQGGWQNTAQAAPPFPMQGTDDKCPF